ncbi:metallophosphatase family protein [Mucilaginibacter daejeonensis]|uniref:metallophosphoesterase family protein n=1 Tax=Mucilaginibacter daejeonensis TaxID=398049 RepID=UPI001D170B33|nr:metallophosphoesterase family protein [Mucilaginibacter daejeonensis]UEG53974.1 metallophosphatase family protein [Mucilaginibacter daejeonensis]
MKRYAIISDVHGNLLALQAILADIQQRGIEQIINLGDHVFGALEPELSANIIRNTPHMLCISGNTDREILEALDVVSEKENMERVKADLSADTIAWLKDLPPTADCDGIFFVCHGTPESDNEYLLELVRPEGVFVHEDEHLVERTKHIAQPIILCGHSHVNRVVHLSSGKVILNPGSVGLPAYLGNGEYRFAMESMTPHAKYAIVSIDSKEQYHIEQIACHYDWNKASHVAKANGSVNWSQFLLHGRMPRDLRSK